MSDDSIVSWLTASQRAPGPTADSLDWVAGAAGRTWMRTEKTSLEELDGWVVDAGTGNLRHHTGRFFSVQGLSVRVPGATVPAWEQPIIDQPEIGILGILARDFDGVPHFLLQAKNEPGNPSGAQLSPTVQATRSNYTRVHRGRSIPYLEYFQGALGAKVLVDTRQSEQGAWFYRKRNRNMVIEVGADVEAVDGFRWFTLGELAELLTVPDLVNMDARTVLACLPSPAAGNGSGPLAAALRRSVDPWDAGAVHTLAEVLSWITEVRTRTEVDTTLRPLAGLAQWSLTDGRIARPDHRYFSVVGVDVEAGGREVAAWSQPMLEPVGTGVVAFLVRDIGGVLHVLVHARTEPGYTDITELAPTVQCVPETYDHLPRRPRFLDEVLSTRRVRFDTTFAEEGGRFLGARNRYVIAETDTELDPADPEYRWLTVGQLDQLLRHSFYVNIQARTLLLCLRTLL